MSLNPGIYTPSRFNLEIHVDEYGTKEFILKTAVQGEVLTVQLATQTSPEGQAIQVAKTEGLRILEQKFGWNDETRELVQTLESEEGTTFWLRFYNPKTNIFQAYELLEYASEKREKT